MKQGCAHDVSDTCERRGAHGRSTLPTDRMSHSLRCNHRRELPLPLRKVSTHV